MYDLFISYKSEERPEALRIMHFLQASGLNCWMDQEKITVGQDYEIVIAKIIPQCHALVLLLSYSSQLSKEVEIEYKMAADNGLPVFPIKIEDCSLTDTYDLFLKHTQVANEYWKSENNRRKVLSCIRDELYKIKGEPAKTKFDLLDTRVGYYQKTLKKAYSRLTKERNRIVQKAVSRCGFMTPQPHYIKAILTQTVLPYQLLVNDYIEDMIFSTSDDSANIKYFCDFYDFVLNNDIITEIRLSYEEFEDIVLNELTYLSSGRNQLDNTFLLRIYKDYLRALNNDIFQHPVVKLCTRLHETNTIKYETFLSHIHEKNDPAFACRTSLTVFLDPRFLGDEYTNICGDVTIDDSRSVFLPSETTHPEWSDFLRKFTCDILLKELERNPGASALTTFFVENTFFSIATDQIEDKIIISGHLNYAYLYLINKWIEARHPEYVKILLRNLGRIDWRRYVGDVEREITALKRFVYCCMIENGYEFSDIQKLWREA